MHEILFSSDFSKRSIGEVCEIFELPNNKLLIITQEKDMMKNLHYPGKVTVSFYANDVVLGVSYKYMVVIVYKKQTTKKETEQEMYENIFSGE